MNIFMFLNDINIMSKLFEDFLNTGYTTFKFSNLENLLLAMNIYKDDVFNVLIVDHYNKQNVPLDLINKFYVISLKDDPTPVDQQDVSVGLEAGYDITLKDILNMMSYYYIMQDMINNNNIKRMYDKKYGDYLSSRLFSRLLPYQRTIVDKLINNETVILSGAKGSGKTFLSEISSRFISKPIININKDMIIMDSYLSKEIDLKSIPKDFLVVIEDIEELPEPIRLDILKLAYNKAVTFMLTTRMKEEDIRRDYSNIIKFFSNIYTLPSIEEYSNDEKISILKSFITNQNVTFEPDAQRYILEHNYENGFNDLKDLGRHIDNKKCEYVTVKDLPLHILPSSKFLEHMSEEDQAFMDLINKKDFRLSVVEEAVVRLVYNKNSYNKAQTCKDLDITDSMLRTKLKNYNIQGVWRNGNYKNSVHNG